MPEDLVNQSDPEATRTMTEEKLADIAPVLPDKSVYVEYASPSGAARQAYAVQSPSPPLPVHYPYPPPSYLYQGMSSVSDVPSYPVYSYPLPLGAAIRHLPLQYLRVLTRPGPTFAREKQKASWNIIWLQLAFLALLGAFLGYITDAFLLPLSFSVLHISTIGSTDVISMYKDQALSGSVQWLIVLPATAFLFGSMTYLLARGFHGQGTYLEHMYCTLLFFVPAQLVSGLLDCIPLMGLFGIPLAFAYGSFVLIRMTMAVHGLDTKKASLTILLLPASAVALLLCGALLVLLILTPLLFL